MQNKYRTSLAVCKTKNNISTRRRLSSALFYERKVINFKDMKYDSTLSTIDRQQVKNEFAIGKNLDSSAILHREKPISFKDMKLGIYLEPAVSKISSSAPIKQKETQDEATRSAYRDRQQMNSAKLKEIKARHRAQKRQMDDMRSAHKLGMIMKERSTSGESHEIGNHRARHQSIK